MIENICRIRFLLLFTCGRGWWRLTNAVHNFCDGLLLGQPVSFPGVVAWDVLDDDRQAADLSLFPPGKRESGAEVVVCFQGLWLEADLENAMLLNSKKFILGPTYLRIFHNLLGRL